MLPQNWLCRHLALNSPLGHFNGDNAQSPQIPDTRNSRWLQSSIPPTATWLSLNYGEHNPSHVRRHTLPSQPSQLLITPFRLYTNNLSTSLAAQTQTQYFVLQIKTILKNTFPTNGIFIFSFIYPTSFSEWPNKLNEETTQRKHTRTLTLLLANNNKTSNILSLLRQGEPGSNGN